jgi:hypothetical protein
MDADAIPMVSVRHIRPPPAHSPTHLVVCNDPWVQLAQQVAGHLPLPVPPVHGHGHNLLHKQGVEARLAQLHQPEQQQDEEPQEQVQGAGCT